MFRPGQWVELIPKTWDKFHDYLRAVLPDGAVESSINIITGERAIIAGDVVYMENDPKLVEFAKNGGNVVEYEGVCWYRIRIGEEEMSFHRVVLQSKQSIDEQVFMDCLLL